LTPKEAKKAIKSILAKTFDFRHFSDITHQTIGVSSHRVWVCEFVQLVLYLILNVKLFSRPSGMLTRPGKSEAEVEVRCYTRPRLKPRPKEIVRPRPRTEMSRKL